MTLQLRTYVGLVLLAIGLLAAGVLSRDRSVPFDSAPFIDQLDDEAVVARGAYLAIAGNCAGCHTTEQGAAMAGGHAFDTPFGVMYATNITQHPTAGIGAWSLDDFARAMRSGKRPNGERLYPAFPYTAYTQLEDADIAASAYLRTIPADSTSAPENDLLPTVSVGCFSPGRRFICSRVRASASILMPCRRGGLSRRSVGPLQCLPLSADQARCRAGRCAPCRRQLSDHVPGGASVRWSAPNLTSDARGLGLWSEEEIAAYLGSGRNRHVEVFGPMRAVVLASTQLLSEDDQRAMARYLANVPARAEPTAPAPDRQTLGRGRTVYNLHCGTCHLPTGEGDPEWRPSGPRQPCRSGRGSGGAAERDPLWARACGASFRVTLAHPMDHYRYELDDEEIAAVATYVRNSWGNAAGAVLPDAVAAQRLSLSAICYAASDSTDEEVTRLVDEASRISTLAPLGVRAGCERMPTSAEPADSASPGRVRLLSGEQYANTIAAVFGRDVSDSVLPPLPPLARTSCLLPAHHSSA